MTLSGAWSFGVRDRSVDDRALYERIDIRRVRNDSERNAVFDIRRTVFIEGQNVPTDLEMDGLDENAEHFIVLEGDTPIGCARVRKLTGPVAKLERIALLSPYRGKGYGRRIVEHLVSHCRSSGIEDIYLHAQCDSRRFYEKCGFTARGPVFAEAGIDHVEMHLKPRESAFPDRNGS